MPRQGLAQVFSLHIASGFVVVPLKVIPLSSKGRVATEHAVSLGEIIKVAVVQLLDQAAFRAPRLGLLRGRDLIEQGMRPVGVVPDAVQALSVSVVPLKIIQHIVPVDIYKNKSF